MEKITLVGTELNETPVVGLKPKTSGVVAFVFDGADLKSMIGFVGKRPVINENGELQYRSYIIKAGSVIFRNETGNVSKVMTLKEADLIYDFIGAKAYNAQDHGLKIKEKK